LKRDPLDSAQSPKVHSVSRLVVHDRWAVVAALAWAFLWGTSAWLAIRQGHPYMLAAVTGLIGVVLALLVARSLVITGDVVVVRRLFGLINQRHALRDIERVIINGDPSTVSANRLLNVRPRVRVKFRDGTAIGFSEYASGLDALVALAGNLKVPLETPPKKHPQA
jgi:hypothetical protein